MKETWIFDPKTKKVFKPTKWYLFRKKLKGFFSKWKLVNTYKNKIIPINELIFRLSKDEKEASESIYKEKGTISYEFYPLGGIGFGLKIHALDTGEIYDITDYSTL